MRQSDTPALGQVREWGPSPVWPEGRGVFLLRPLLDVRRADLRMFLADEGWSWLDDPANEDLHFARVRARRRLQPSSLVGEGGIHASAWEGEGGGGANPLPPVVASAGPLPLPQGERGFRLTPDGRIVARGPLSARFVSAASLCTGGEETPPRGPRLARLIEQLEEGGDFTVTLAGSRVTAVAGDVVFGREAGERSRGGLAPVALPPGAVAIWDGRYAVTAKAAGWRVEALAGRVGALSKPERAWLKTLPPSARSALPVLVSDNQVVLPAPFGAGPAFAESLVEARLFAACGLLDRE